MISLNNRDLYWTLRMVPRRVVNLMQSHRKAFLAGGFVRACVAGEQPSDVDLFAPDEERASLYASVLAGTSGRIHKSANAYTVRSEDLRLPVQVIYRWAYKRPEDLVASFDFTVAKAAVWCASDRDEATHRAGWDSVAHDDFYSDLAAKRLVYTSPQRNEDAGGSLLRVLKFYQRGYRIPLDSMGAVLARLVMGVKGLAFDELNGFALGVGDSKETALAKVLTGLLHEVDPLQDPQHLFHLPSGEDDASEGPAI